MGQAEGEVSHNNDFYFLLIAVICVILLGTFFVLNLNASCATFWVITNLILGYIALSEDKIRNRYMAIVRAMKNILVWSYALLMLALVLAPVLFLFLLYPHSPNSTTAGNVNPFVSNIIFVLTIIPIVPLFAYAETIVFQKYIISGILKNYRYRCPHCGGVAIGTQRCDLCGYPRQNPIPAGIKWTAVMVSATVFSIAHILLVGSIFAGLTFIGGCVLGDLYIKDGWLPVAATHALYDYFILAGVIGVMLI